MLSKAEQTILAVLLWQASSKGRKKVSTCTQDGFSSGRTDEDFGDLSPPPALNFFEYLINALVPKHVKSY